MNETRERGTEHGTVVVEQWLDGAWCVVEPVVAYAAPAEDYAAVKPDDPECVRQDWQAAPALYCPNNHTAVSVVADDAPRVKRKYTKRPK